MIVFLALLMSDGNGKKLVHTPTIQAFLWLRGKNLCGAVKLSLQWKVSDENISKVESIDLISFKVQFLSRCYRVQVEIWEDDIEFGCASHPIYNLAKNQYSPNMAPGNLLFFFFFFSANSLSLRFNVNSNLATPQYYLACTLGFLSINKICEGSMGLPSSSFHNPF